VATNFTFRQLEIPEILLISTSRFRDNRGYFQESYHLRDYADAGIVRPFVQENQSFSVRHGTVRGLHFQRPPLPQAKLVRVTQGRIFDVAVDIRKGSPTFGRWCGTTLTADGGEQLFIPHGFAHAFCTLAPDTEVSYKVDNFYDRGSDAGFRWDDPVIGIAWPIDERDAILSDRDRQLPLFGDIDSPFHM
jgi:dTDP-4-dehydrorhamnose 3,5-epimerase